MAQSKKTKKNRVVIMYFFYLNGKSFSFVQRNNFDYYKIINGVIITLNFYWITGFQILLLWSCLFRLLKKVYLNFSNFLTFLFSIVWDKDHGDLYN